MIYKLNGRILYGAFKHEGISYPANWLALSSDVEKLAIGVTIEQSPVVETPYETLRANAITNQIALINADYSTAIHDMVKDTPDFERESWPKQEAEAKAFSIEQSSQTPYIDKLALSRGIPREILLTKVLEKVSLYEEAHAHLTGIRQAKEDALKALPEDCTLEDIEAITWAS